MYHMQSWNLQGSISPEGSIVKLLFLKGYKAAPHGFCFHGFLQVATDVVAPALGGGELTSQVLRVHNGVREEVEVHILVEVLKRVELIPILAEVLNQLGIGFSKGLGVSDAHDSVHGVVCGYCVHADPLDFHLDRPFGEIR